MALTALHQSLCAEERPRGITFGLIYLAFTENDPGKTILGADGKPFHYNRPWSLTQVRAAKAVLVATARGQKRTILTAPGHTLALVQALLPVWSIGSSETPKERSTRCTIPVLDPEVDLVHDELRLNR